MKTVCRIAAFAAFLAGSTASAQQLAPSPTLDAIKARGHIECGVHLGLPGFSFANDKGEWTGLDVDYCKALAAAVLGDATKVKFTPTSVQQRWAVLQSGQVDLLSRNTTITFFAQRHARRELPGINFYEGQTFVVRTKAKVAAVKDLADATICVAAGSTEEKTAADCSASATSRSPSSTSRRTTMPSRPTTRAAAMPTPRASARWPDSASSSRIPTSIRS